MKKIGKSALGSPSMGYDKKFEEFKEELMKAKLEEQTENVGSEQPENSLKKVQSQFVETLQPKDSRPFGIRIDNDDEDEEDLEE